MFNATSKWILVLGLIATSPLASGCFGFMDPSEIRTVNDPFQGPVRGFMIYTDYSATAGLAVKQATNDLTLQVMVVERGHTTDVAGVGDPAEFAVGSEVLTLKNTVEAQPVSNVLNYGIITQWQVTFKPDAQTLARFANAPLNAVKVHIGGKEYQIALSPDKAAKFQANMASLTSSAAAPPGGPAPSAAPSKTASR